MNLLDPRLTIRVTFVIAFVAAISTVSPGVADTREQAGEAWPELKAGDAIVSRTDDAVFFELAARPPQGRIKFARLNNVVLQVSASTAPVNTELRLTQDPSMWSIELPESLPFPTEIRMAVHGTPLLMSVPYVATPSGDGAIVLSACHAIVHGDKLQFEPQIYKNTVGYWVDSHAWAEWHFQVKQRGQYVVRVLQGCGAGQGGSQVAVVLNNSAGELSRVPFTVRETGHFQNFVWRDIGKIGIDPGAHRLDLRVLKLARTAVMDVRQIRLEPVGRVSNESLAMADVEPDLVPPRLVRAEPRPGQRVRQTVDGYDSQRVYHALYLPTDWREDQAYPVIVELTGNGPYRNQQGDVCEGTVENAVMGLGITGGYGAIWLTLPFLNDEGVSNVKHWWGTPPQYRIEKTLDYWQRALDETCAKYGGDPRRIVLAGFSRGSLAANRLGLANDQIAARWCAFICYSHYDGVVETWPYPEADRAAAVARLGRLGERAQFICSETGTGPTSLGATQNFLHAVHPTGNFLFHRTGFRNHSDRWLLRPSHCRTELRAWLTKNTQTD